MSSSETWDLESIFPGGSRSAAFADFLAQLAADFDRADVAGLPGPLTPATEPDWLAVIEIIYDLGQRLHHAAAFGECLVAQDVHDDTAMQLEATIGRLSGQLGVLWTNLSAALARQEDSAWAQLLTQPALEPVAFHLNEERDEARQKMAPEMEALVTELAVDGYHAWDRLYGLTSGTKQVEFAGQPMSLGQLQAKMYDDPNPAVRRDAFTLFESAWTDIAKPCAAALNNQAGFRLTLYKHRGWDSVLKEPLQNNRLSAPTLEAMWGVVDAKSARLLDYFAAKARLLGLDQLGWTDVPAPLGESSRAFTYPEAAAFVVDHLSQFNPHLGDFAKMAVAQRWVEAENRPGKRAGGFCTDLPLKQQTRIFMTYTGSFDGLLTLAHELGHAYHSWVMRDLPTGARRYAMSVAETASTFAEEVVRDAALRSAATPAEKLALLGAKLNDAAGFLMNIRCRFGFETAFFRERAKKSLTVDELSALMLTAQQEAYKNGLSSYHPLFWASKLHFYITAAPFYNFPYTFGYLFSSGVYAQALAEGPAFKERYIALLRDTGRMTTETLARTHLGVDLTQPTFWEAAVDRVLANVDEFVALAAVSNSQLT